MTSPTGPITVQPAGTTDISAAIAAAIAQIKASLRTSPTASWWGPLATAYLVLPPGDYTITEPEALLGLEGMTGPGIGLVIEGAGYALTTVAYNPTASGTALMKNSWWQGIRMRGIRFVTTQKNTTFLQTNTTPPAGASYTSTAAQDYVFEDCMWEGFTYITDLIGPNNNSEYRFVNCYNLNMPATGAWWHCGQTGNTETADQSLNYWWYGCKHWSTSAPIVDAWYGGHFNIYGMDASDFGNYGNGPYGAPCLFYFHGSAHYEGMCSASINGLRAELKNAAATVLNSQWNYGTIAFNSFDMSSQLFAYTYTGDVINVGPSVNVVFRDSMLGGHVNGSAGRVNPILLDNCQWFQQATPQAICPGGGLRLVNTMTTPTTGAQVCWNTTV